MTTIPSVGAPLTSEAGTPCPNCGAPCKTTVLMRGGDHGWGTSDRERTRYRYAPPDLLGALRRLEVAANTVAYCYDKRPENFASALRGMQVDAEHARAVIAAATGEAP